MAVDGTAMYKLPELYNNSSPIEPPKCMYKMENYHIDPLEHEASTQSPSTGDLQNLETRQENILKELDILKNEVSSLAGKLGVKLMEKIEPMSVDYVISASPQNPPMSLFVIQRLINQRGLTHSTAVFVHSSATQADTKNLPEFEKPKQDKERKSPIILTVVWKNVPHLPCLVLSSSHTPLVGEFTIARYLCRTVLPDLYGKLNLNDLAQVDHWINVAQSLLGGNSKEKASALRNLNSHLGKSQFLVSEKLTLADIAVASAVLQSNSAASAPGNVKQWLKKLPTLC